MSYHFSVVDAFTDTVFTGNPACIIVTDAFPSAARMQAMAAEHNLSETAFVVPDGADYQLRWFTPTVEVDLCGHATLASAFVLHGQGRPGPYRFHTRSGMLTATKVADSIVLDFPARDFIVIPAPEGIADALGVIPLACLRSADLIAVLASAAAVESLKPDLAAIRRLPGGAVIVTAAGGTTREGEAADVTSRYFAPAYGIDEDPVTGSLHTQVMPYWADVLCKPDLICRQASARGGEMRCGLRGDRVTMQGKAVLYARGEVFA